MRSKWLGAVRCLVEEQLNPRRISSHQVKDHDMTQLRTMLTLISLVVVLTTMAPTSAQSFTTEEFHRLHKQLQTSDQEPWRTIPWMTSLLEAQNKAAITQKPIFIWAMDGHPLGCT